MKRISLLTFIICSTILSAQNTNELTSYFENDKIKIELKSLLDLKNIKESNPELRALSYHLYENNGVVKRENVSIYLDKLNQEERKKLRTIGVKFGRYHIFLFKLFKPSSVSLRILLWKNFNEKNKEVKLVPEMLNLLGCNKEDFLKLIKKMNYLSFTKNDETYFRYSPLKSYKKQISTKVLKKENPFNILKNINFK